MPPPRPRPPTRRRSSSVPSRTSSPTARSQSAQRLDLVVHHHRSQEDRDHVPLHGPGVLRAGSGVEALLIRVQLGAPENTLVTPESTTSCSMHGTTMIFLVVVPVWAGFMNYLLPLMIGARDVAFPRLNACMVVLDVPVRRSGAVRLGLLQPARGRLVLLRAAVVEGVLALQRPGEPGSAWSTSPASPRSWARSTSSRRSTTCARPAWAGACAIRVDDPDLRVPDHPPLTSLAATVTCCCWTATSGRTSSTRTRG